MKQPLPFPFSNSYGMSLIEILVGLGLMMLILLVIFGFLSSIFKSDKNVEAYEALQQASTLVINDLIQEVRWSEDFKWNLESPYASDTLQDVEIQSKDSNSARIVHYYVDQDGILHKNDSRLDNANEAIAFTPEDIKITRFTATNIAYGTKVPLIQFKLEMEKNALETTLYTSRTITISLRQKQISF